MNAITSVILMVSLLIAAVPRAWADSPTAGRKHVMAPPEDLKWGECPPMVPRGARCVTLFGDPQVPGGQYTIRSKMPDNFRIPPHTHPADEHLTVISGTFRMGLGEKFNETNMTPMSIGSFMVMPSGLPHFASARGETILQIHGVGPLDFTYIDPNDDPRTE